MSFVVETGRIEIGSPIDEVAWSTDDGFFHTIDVLTASVAIGNRSFADNTYANNTESFLLGTCDPACTDVIGALKFTLNNNNAGMAFDRWHTLMGGSVLWVIDGHTLTGTSPDPNSGVHQMVWYDVEVVNGEVWLHRRAVCTDASRGTYTVISHTIEFYLECGLYTVDIPAPPRVAKTHEDRDGGTGPTYSFNNARLGPEAPDRRVVVFAHACNASGTPGVLPTSVTIDGVPMTIHGGAIGSATNEASVACASLIVPEDNTLDIEVIYPDAQICAGIDVFVFRDLKNTEPQLYAIAAEAVTSLGRTIRRGPAEIILAGATQFRTGSDVTAAWSHGWKATDRELENNRNATSAVIVDGDGEIDLTCTFTASGDVAFLAAVWG